MAINLKIVNKLKRSAKTCDCKFQYKLIGVLNASYHFYIVLAIAAFGLIMNLDEFLFSIVKTLISFAVIALIIYLIYYFFFLTEDQRKYKRAARKYKRRNKKH